ncbi:DASH family cryptochrome [Vibrio sp. WXL210]|uniref:DASH family cryptochrome n=1 Tax=Vibrio sp. WXL210 TaxID=3450709 RepID=UPI003EC60940
MRIGIYYFHRDLRLADNALLHSAANECDQLAFIYVKPEPSVFSRHFSPHATQGKAQANFEQQCISDLKRRLAEYGHVLHTFCGQPSQVLTQLLGQNPHISDLYHDCGADYQQHALVRYLNSTLPEITTHIANQGGLFDLEQLPFALSELPASFTPFRKKVDNITPRHALDTMPDNLPPLALINDEGMRWLTLEPIDDQRLFVGGETSGQAWLRGYFDSQRPSYYKQTRNHLDDWTKSTGFSPWLAWGCISPKQIVECLEAYQQNHGYNESTYWIWFELLWREYFRWYAEKHSNKLFSFGGIKGSKPLTTFYSQQYRQWTEGCTGFAIVDACMRQLKYTGTMSNRGRQLVASCFVHELGLDWRFGAAYFEAMLIDYDVCSNWGNWQYLAGVGADPRGHRRFDLQKQTEIYDPDEAFIQRWLSDDTEINQG